MYRSLVLAVALASLAAAHADGARNAASNLDIVAVDLAGPQTNLTRNPARGIVRAGSLGQAPPSTLSTMPARWSISSRNARISAAREGNASQISCLRGLGRIDRVGKFRCLRRLRPR